MIPHIYDGHDKTFSLVKETSLGEHLRWSLYGQPMNIFNHHRFYAIQTNFSNASFGVPSSVSFPRQIQLGTRLRFQSLIKRFPGDQLSMLAPDISFLQQKARKRLALEATY